MEIEELNKLTQKYMWIKEIVENHTKLIRIIEKEEGNFRLSIIGNGDSTYDINPFFSIPDIYLIDGLKASIENCQKRMKEIEVLCKQ